MDHRTAAQAILCKGVPVPDARPGADPGSAVGAAAPVRRQARPDPDLCPVCELMFRFVTRRRNVATELKILFADLRDYAACLGAAKCWMWL